MDLRDVLQGLGLKKVEEDDTYEYWHYRLAPRGAEIAVHKSDFENFKPSENGILNVIACHIHAIGKADERERIRKAL